MEALPSYGQAEHSLLHVCMCARARGAQRVSRQPCRATGHRPAAPSNEQTVAGPPWGRSFKFEGVIKHFFLEIHAELLEGGGRRFPQIPRLHPERRRPRPHLDLFLDVGGSCRSASVPMDLQIVSNPL